MIVFFYNDAATTEIYTLSLPRRSSDLTGYGNAVNVYHTTRAFGQAGVAGLMIEDQTWPKRCGHMRSEEHTSELQSRQYLVCRLLLEKKKSGITSGYVNNHASIIYNSHS